MRNFIVNTYSPPENEINNEKIQAKRRICKKIQINDPNKLK